MSERDLIQELKSTSKDLSEEKDGLVQSLGHKIADKDKEVVKLQAKLDTKEKLLAEALIKIKDIYNDSTKYVNEEDENEE